MGRWFVSSLILPSSYPLNNPSPDARSDLGLLMFGLCYFGLILGLLPASYRPPLSLLWARPERFMCVNFMLTASGDLTL